MKKKKKNTKQLNQHTRKKLCIYSTKGGIEVKKAIIHKENEYKNEGYWVKWTFTLAIELKNCFLNIHLIFIKVLRK